MLDASAPILNNVVLVKWYQSLWESLTVFLEATIKAVYLLLACLAFTSHVNHDSVCLESSTFRYRVMLGCLKNKVAFKNIYVEVKNVLVICCFLCVSNLLLFCIQLGCFYIKVFEFLALKYFLLQLIFPLWKMLQSSRSFRLHCTMLPFHGSALDWIFEVVLDFPEKFDAFQ